MNKLNRKVSIFLIINIILLFFSFISIADGIPKPGTHYYHDEVGVLSEDTKKEIDDINKKLESATKSQIIVAVVKNTGDSDINEYATAFFEKWKIGDSEKDNGILFITSMDDRKSKIEVGYGLEGAIPDGKSGRILDEYVIPYFKDKNYDSGINNGFKAIVAEVQKEYNIESLNDVKPEESEEDAGSAIIKLIIALVLFFIIFRTPRGPRRSRRTFYGGSSFGGFSGGSGSGFGGFSGGGGSSGGGGASRGW